MAWRVAPSDSEGATLQLGGYRFTCGGRRTTDDGRRLAVAQVAAAQAAVDRFYQAAAAEGVRVADGNWFGDEAWGFRLGFGFPPPNELKAALDALTTALRQAKQ